MDTFVDCLAWGHTIFNGCCLVGVKSPQSCHCNKYDSDLCLVWIVEHGTLSRKYGGAMTGAVNDTAEHTASE